MRHYKIADYADPLPKALQARRDRPRTADWVIVAILLAVGFCIYGGAFFLVFFGH